MTSVLLLLLLLCYYHNTTSSSFLLSRAHRTLRVYWLARPASRVLFTQRERVGPIRIALAARQSITSIQTYRAGRVVVRSHSRRIFLTSAALRSCAGSRETRLVSLSYSFVRSFPSSCPFSDPLSLSLFRLSLSHATNFPSCTGLRASSDGDCASNRNKERRSRGWRRERSLR